MRPKVDAPVFFDTDGSVINYGNRWPEGPPDDSYSVATNRERFAPLHVVADSLIHYLVANYQVRVEEGMELLETVGERPFGPPAAEDIVRVIRLVPEEDCSPITFIYTSYPGIYVYAGLLGSFGYPACGCDACDETWESAVQELEEDVLAIVGGRYRESVDLDTSGRSFSRPGMHPDLGPGRSCGWQIEGPERSFRRSSTFEADAVGPSTLKMMERQLRELAEVTPDGSWKAWPVNRDDGSG